MLSNVYIGLLPLGYVLEYGVAYPVVKTSLTVLFQLLYRLEIRGKKQKPPEKKKGRKKLKTRQKLEYELEMIPALEGHDIGQIFMV